MPTNPPLTLAELVAAVGDPQQLLEEHRDDGSGRCAVCCENGGVAGGARVKWPCWLYSTADRARQSSGR